MNLDFFKEVNLAVTVSDTEGNVVYQNDSSVDVNGDVRGKNMMGCHNERSQQIIRHMLEHAATNVYTISKKGKNYILLLKKERKNYEEEQRFLTCRAYHRYRDHGYPGSSYCSGSDPLHR